MNSCTSTLKAYLLRIQTTIRQHATLQSDLKVLIYLIVTGTVLCNAFSYAHYKLLQMFRGPSCYFVIQSIRQKGFFMYELHFVLNEQSFADWIWRSGSFVRRHQAEVGRFVAARFCAQTGKVFPVHDVKLFACGKQTFIVAVVLFYFVLPILRIFIGHVASVCHFKTQAKPQNCSFCTGCLLFDSSLICVDFAENYNAEFATNSMTLHFSCVSGQNFELYFDKISLLSKMTIFSARVAIFQKYFVICKFSNDKMHFVLQKRMLKSCSLSFLLKSSLFLSSVAPFVAFFGHWMILWALFLVDVAIATLAAFFAQEFSTLACFSATKFGDKNMNSAFEVVEKDNKITPNEANMMRAFVEASLEMFG